MIGGNENEIIADVKPNGRIYFHNIIIHHFYTERNGEFLKAVLSFGA